MGLSRPPIHAFVFDLDGVITDTAEYHYLAWQRLCDEEGLSFSRADNDTLRGLSRRDSLLKILKGAAMPEERMEQLMTRKNDYYRDFLRKITPTDLLPGVGEFLRAARKKGIHLGLASASKNAKDVIENLQVSDFFEAVGDGYSVVNSKPAPDLFVWVAGRLGVPPAEVVIFEDAEAGVEAAHAAGMRVVGLGPIERVGKADILYPGLESVTVEAVLMALG